MNDACEPAADGRRAAGDRAALAAAYRDGLGLAAVAVIRDPTGIRICAVACGDDGAFAAAESVEARWWCRRATEAARVAAAATARLRRGESRSGGAPTPVLACASVEAAAKRLNVALQSDDEIFDEAMKIVARVDAEMQKLQRSGGLKSINKAYRDYRLDTSARGERVLRYAEYVGRYRENLVRKLAAALRYI